MNTLIVLLQNPLIWLAASVICGVAIVHDWKSERSQKLFQAVWGASLFANATLFGVSLVTYNMVHGETIVQTLLG